MQIIHPADSIERANKSKLTPYDYLYQRERRRQPGTKGRQTAEGSWDRHLEDDWLDMKDDGKALLWLTFPDSFDYRTKCHVIGSLQPNSVEYLLKTWTAEMQKTSLGYLLELYRVPGRPRREKMDEARQTVDDLTQHLRRELNISSEEDTSGVWNSTIAVPNSWSEARRALLATSLEKLASALETAQTLVSEATLHGTIYETGVDTMRSMQETRGFLQLLTKIVKDKNYSSQTPLLPAGENGPGVNPPPSPFSAGWSNNVYNTAFSRQPGLGEPRFVAPGSELSLTAAQHAQLGHNTENNDPNWAFPRAKGSKKTTEASQQKKKRKIG